MVIESRLVSRLITELTLPSGGSSPPIFAVQSATFSCTASSVDSSATPLQAVLYTFESPRPSCEPRFWGRNGGTISEYEQCFITCISLTSHQMESQFISALIHN